MKSNLGVWWELKTRAHHRSSEQSRETRSWNEVYCITQNAWTRPVKQLGGWYVLWTQHQPFQIEMRQSSIFVRFKKCLSKTRQCVDILLFPTKVENENNSTGINRVFWEHSSAIHMKLLLQRLSIAG